MIISLLTIILLALIPACFSFFLDYCLGKPMSNEPSRKAIFSPFSLWMAKKRLKSMGLLYNKERHFEKELPKDAAPDEIEGNKDALKLTILLDAQKYYTYEQALGMCPFCTNFWVCQLFSLLLFFTVHIQYLPSIAFFVLIPIFSHSILRKL